MLYEESGIQRRKKKEIMEKCYECYCENGIRDTGIKELGKYCGMTSANLYAWLKKRGACMSRLRGRCIFDPKPDLDNANVGKICECASCTYFWYGFF